MNQLKDSINEVDNIDFTSLNEKELIDCLHLACENGNLPLVRHLLTNEQLSINADADGSVTLYPVLDTSYNKLYVEYNKKALHLAAKNNHIELVEYLCESKELKVHADLRFLNDYILTLLAKENNIEMIELLINHPTLKDKPQINSHVVSEMIHAKVNFATIKYFLNDEKYNFNNGDIDDFFMVGCIYGHLEVVKYLLTGSDLKFNAKLTLDFIEKHWFMIAFHKHFNIIDYLLNDPFINKEDSYLKDHLEKDLMNEENSKLQLLILTINSSSLENFLDCINNISNLEETICKYGSDDLANYIVYKRKVIYTEKIKNLELNPSLRKAFETRELHDKLSEDLEEKNNNCKIKI